MREPTSVQATNDGTRTGSNQAELDTSGRNFWIPMVWSRSNSLARKLSAVPCGKLVISLTLDLGRASRWQWVGGRDAQLEKPQAAQQDGWISKVSADLAYAVLQQSAILPACTGQNSLVKSCQAPLQLQRHMPILSNILAAFSLPTMQTTHNWSCAPSLHTHASSHHRE